MYGMFNNTGAGSESYRLNLNGWNTSNVTDMAYMFYEAGRDALTFELSINNWNISNVIKMGQMFYKTGLNADYLLDLTGWREMLLPNINKITKSQFNYKVESKVLSPFN